MADGVYACPSCGEPFIRTTSEPLVWCAGVAASRFHLPREEPHMQRPTTTTIRAQCSEIAAVAAPEDSYRRIAEKVEGLSERQVQRRIEHMERDLGMQPAPPAENGGGRMPRDGSPRQHSRAYRRAGTVARTWQRRCGEDCL